jgi:hypothetical protein
MRFAETAHPEFGEPVFASRCIHVARVRLTDDERKKMRRLHRVQARAVFSLEL